MTNPESFDQPRGMHVMRFLGSGIPQPTIEHRETSRGITYSIPGERPAAEIITIITEPLDEMRAKGPEHVELIAKRVMYLLGTEVPPLSSVAEASSILGVSKQRVDQLRYREMPPLVKKLLAGPLWSTYDLVVYALRDRFTRPAGRPSKNS